MFVNLFEYKYGNYKYFIDLVMLCWIKVWCFWMYDYILRKYFYMNKGNEEFW